MKKIMFCMAVAGMFAFAACNSNKPAENTECDTTAKTECTEAAATEAEAVADTTVAEEATPAETPAQ